MAKRNYRQQKKHDQKVRMDSYQNLYMNIGTGGDRSAYSRIKSGRLLTQQELTDIYMGDGIGARIVDCVAEEMLRAGFEIDGVDDTTKIMSRWDEIDLTQSMTDAVAWSRLYGGSLIVMLVNDGGGLTDELRDGELESVRVYDRYEVQVQEKEENPESENYGQPLIYTITPHHGGTSYDIHASRCIRFDGERLPNRVRSMNQGWGASALQRIHDSLARFGMGHIHASSLLERMQQGVWGAKDLAGLCGSDEGTEVVKKRLNMVDMTRSIGNTLAIDSESETYELLNGTVAGVTDVLKEMKNLICAISGIDEQVLFTTTPTGIGADKVTVPESFKQLIGRKQRDEARPAVEKLVSLLTDEQVWTIKFKPLSVPSEQDDANTANAQSQADERYVSAGVISQDELRNTLRKRGRYAMGDEDLPEDDDDEESLAAS